MSRPLAPTTVDRAIRQQFDAWLAEHTAARDWAAVARDMAWLQRFLELSAAEGDAA